MYKGNRYDIKGNRYGRLIVLGFAYTVRRRGSYWNCQCDCGISKVIKRDSLVGGATTSCGCYHKEVVSKRTSLDLTGHIFGRLVVKEKTGLRNRCGSIKWLCFCDCGNTCLVSTACLKSGDTKSCGCLNKESARIVGLKNAGKGNGVGDIEVTRKSIGYKNWRENVFERDDFICSKCGVRGCRINAHHIISYKVSEGLRLDMNNGITLCEGCHIRFHKEYGKKQYDSMNLSKFLN